MNEEKEKNTSSEQKDNTNKHRSGHRQRHGKGHGFSHQRGNQAPKPAQNNQSPQNNQNNNQKQQDKSQNQQRKPVNQKHTQQPAPKTKDSEKPKENNQPSEANANQKVRDKNRNRQNRSRRDDTQKASSLSLSSSLLDTAPEDDILFGHTSFSQTSKPQKTTYTAEELAEVRQFTDEELFGTSHLFHAINSTDEGAIEVVSIRFKKTGKAYFFDPCGHKFKVGDAAILDTARGLEFGEVSEANRTVSPNEIIQPLRQVVRAATQEDIEHHKNNKRREDEAFKICVQKILDHGLDMKLIEAQYAFDNSKLLFFFTSAGRVDFRELVRDLASVFRTRIELRQIGIRDESKLIGGIGICGRPLCCARFLSNFAQVSIKMAKEQGLSLNSGKISGNCGRLMCCLNFENQTYLDEIKNTPMPGSIVKIDGKLGTVTEATPLIGMLKVHLNDAPEGEIVTIHRDSVTVVSKKGNDAEENDAQES